MKVLIGTKNQGKIEGAKRALSHYFEDVEIQGIPVKTNVSEQPVDEQIYIGAQNRIENLKKYAKEKNLDVDFYLAIESGIQNTYAGWMIVNIAIIEDKNEFKSYGTSPAFPVPNKLVEKIIHTDFSHVMNTLFEEDPERHNRGGGIQLLTHHVISRIDLTETAFVMALTQLVNGDKWK